MQSGAIASRLRAVSRSVSPLVTLDVETLTLTASADKRFAAISKDVRVRVEGSKKRLMTVRPRRAGTFLISRRETSRKVSAVSSRCVISSAERSRIPRRCFRLKTMTTLDFGLWTLGFGLGSLDLGFASFRAELNDKDPRPKTQDLTIKKAATVGRFSKPFPPVVVRR